MARDIIDSPTPEERVRQLVDKRQAEHDALFDADEYLFGREQLAEQRERIAEALEAKVQAVTAEQRHRREAAGRTVSGEETIPAPDDCADCGSAARRLEGRDRLRRGRGPCWTKGPWERRSCPNSSAGRQAAGGGRTPGHSEGGFGKALQANCRTRINIELARQSAERRGMLRTLEKKAKEFLEMDRGGQRRPFRRACAFAEYRAVQSHARDACRCRRQGLGKRGSLCRPDAGSRTHGRGRRP